MAVLNHAFGAFALWPPPAKDDDDDDDDDDEQGGNQGGEHDASGEGAVDGITPRSGTAPSLWVGLCWGLCGRLRL